MVSLYGDDLYQCDNDTSTWLKYDARGVARLKAERWKTYVDDTKSIYN